MLTDKPLGMCVRTYTLPVLPLDFARNIQYLEIIFTPPLCAWKQ